MLKITNMVPLGTLISPAKTVRCGDDSYPVLSMTMHNGLVFQDDKFKKEIASKDKSDYKVVYRNQLVISFPIDEGVLAAQRIADAGIVSPAYGIWDIDHSQILPEFLEKALRCERAIAYYKAKLRGSTARRRSLPTPTLLEFTVPLPSLETQEAILGLVNKVKLVIDKREQELQRLNDLIKARFVEMFGMDVSDGVPLRECCIDVRGGGTPSMKHPEYYGGDVPFIKSGDVKDNLVFSGALWLTEKALSETTAKYIPEGSVIVVNRSAALLKEFRAAITGQPVVINQDIKAFIPKTTYTSQYLLWAIKIQTQYLLTKVTTVLTSHIDLKDLLELRIVPAPVEKQKAFSAFVKQIDKSKVVA